MFAWILDLPELSSTERAGRLLGPLLFRGAVIALIGPLGAGKTHFTRAVAEGLQIHNPNHVSSPTFVLIQEYTARLPIYHFDVYRLKAATEFHDLGAAEYLASDGVCLIEWADRIQDALPTNRLEIEFELVGESQRRLRITATGGQYESLLNTWRAALTSIAS